MTVRTSCPLCNSAFDLVAMPPDRRLTCPRCGESFPFKGDDTQLSFPTFSENGTSSPAPAQVEPKSWANMAVIGLVAAVVVVGVGLFVIFRPDRETKPVEQARKPAATMPPAGIASLMYLPQDTSVAFAVQPGPIQTYAERTKTDPKELLLQSGIPPRFFALLDQAGIKLEQVDHIAGGLVIAGDNPIPRVIFAISLLDPLADEDAFLKPLKAQKFTAANGASRWKTDLGGLPTEMAKLGDRGYLFASDGKDLNRATPETVSGPGHLSVGLRQSMEKLSPASVVWVATENTRWEDKPAVKLVAGLMSQPDLPARLANVRAVAVGISLEPDPKLTGAVRAPDEASAKKLADSAGANLAGKQVLIGTAGEWVTVESPFDPKQGLTSGIQGLLPKKP